MGSVPRWLLPPKKHKTGEITLRILMDVWSESGRPLMLDFSKPFLFPNSIFVVGRETGSASLPRGDVLSAQRLMRDALFGVGQQRENAITLARFMTSPARTVTAVARECGVPRNKIYLWRKTRPLDKRGNSKLCEQIETVLTKYVLVLYVRIATHQRPPHV